MSSQHNRAFIELVKNSQEISSTLRVDLTIKARKYRVTEVYPSKNGLTQPLSVVSRVHRPAGRSFWSRNTCNSKHALSTLDLHTQPALAGWQRGSRASSQPASQPACWSTNQPFHIPFDGSLSPLAHNEVSPGVLSPGNIVWQGPPRER